MATSTLLFNILAGSFSAFQFGFNSGVVNQPRTAITDCKYNENCIPLDDWQWGAFVSSFLLGGVCGALIAGSLTAKFGRRRMLLYNNVFYAIGTILISSANDIYGFIFGRVVVGIGCGIGTVVLPIYIAELSPSSIRGTMGSLNQFCIVIGVFTSQLIGVAWSTKEMWRYLFAFGLVPVVFQCLLLYFYCVESPKWLAINNLFGESKNSLKRLRHTHEVDSEYAEILSSCGISSSSSSENVQIANESEALESTSLLPSPATSAQKANLTILQLFTTPHVRLPFILALSLHVTQQLSGINAATYYSTTIFEQSYPKAEFGNLALYLTFSLSALGVVVMFPGFYFIEKLGRRTLLMTSISTMLIFCGMIVINGQKDSDSGRFWVVFGLLGFVSTFGIGLGAIPWLIVPELVPSYAVSAAGSLCVAVNWGCNFLVAFFLPAFISYGKDQMH
ncbi:Solute carrier 2, facilitated glucose transporter member 3 [Nowakowskiella sp. JEL0407]|nr:Solute carrier 2, facilitated glucose transporter member 3 [Nowakowskiella sp. JEL0407]